MPYHTRIVVLDTPSPASHMICQALRSSYPQVGFHRAGHYTDMVNQLSARDVMAVVMDWDTARQPWEKGSVAEHVRETYPDTILVIVDGQRPEKKTDAVPLTKREREVMSHLQYGARNQEIADKMGLQVITVKLHVRSLCRKIGVQNRTQLALWANTML